MKSTIRKSTFQAIYRLLNRVSPLNQDCGQLCGAACCTCDENGDTDDFDMGIYLLPGEEKLFTMEEEWLRWSLEYAQDFDFPDSWFGKIYFIRCKTPPHCPRHMRPLQCRFFPLSPYLDQQDCLRLILCPSDLPYSCPLIEQNLDLTPSFVQATYTVWKHLIRDPYIYDLVKMDSEDLMDDQLDFVFIK